MTAKTLMIMGTYLHGLFDNDAFRHAWLRSLGWHEPGQAFDRQLAYNRLANHVRTHLDVDAIHSIIWGPDKAAVTPP